MNHSEDHERPNIRTTRILHARPTLSISPDVPGAYGDHLPVNIEFPQMSTNILDSYQHRQSLAIPPTPERSCRLERARGGPKRRPNQTEPRKEPADSWREPTSQTRSRSSGWRTFLGRPATRCWVFSKTDREQARRRFLCHSGL